MSLWQCESLQRTLPDAVTCGVLCDEFPSCLPKFSASVIRRVAKLQSPIAEVDDLRAIVEELTHGGMDDDS